MVEEYISREAAIAARKRSCDRNCAECDFAINGDSWCNGEVFVVDLLRIPAADVRPVVLCKDCCLYGKCATEDVFRFAGLEEDNRFCGAGRIKRNAATDGEARRLRKQLTLNELGYSYDFPNREG